MKKFLSLLLLALLLNLHVCSFAENISDKIDVSLTQVPINSKLKKQYNGYKYTITNQANQDLNLVNAQVINGVNGSVAYQATNDQHPIATTWAICGPVGLITLGIGWVVGIVATPIVWIVSDSNSKKAQQESVSYPNIVSTGVVHKGEAITTDFLVPIGTKPQLKMTVQPENTKDLIFISK